MKKNIYLIIGGLLGATLLTASCDDKLSELPTQSKVEGNLVVDQKSAKAALNGIYYRHALCGTDYYDVLSTKCCSQYEIYPANIAGIITYYQGAYQLETHGGNYYYSYTNGTLWSAFYSQLTTANSVIKEVGEAPDSWFTGNTKQEILGEAHFMRALIHYNLLRHFGYYWDINSPYGCILRTEPSNTSNLPKARSSVKETYEQILEDLDYAIASIKEENPNYYANIWVAKGQKARVLMMRGEGQDYADAAALTQEIIQNGPYELEENVTDIFHSKGLNSKEVMFGIQPKSNQTNVYEAYYYRGSSQWYPTEKFMALFEHDPRKARLFKTEVQSLPTVNYLYDDAGNYIGYEIVYVDTEVTTICKHFSPENIAASDIEESQYQMRLTEMYLLRAEALLRSQGTAGIAEAKTLLRTVLAHAGYTDFSMLDAATDIESMMKLIFEEDLRNLFCESGRELELMLRFPKKTVTAFNPEYEKEGMSIFAIPSDEFKYNNLLPKSMQNPGYPTE